LATEKRTNSVGTEENVKPGASAVYKPYGNKQISLITIWPIG